jgi:hypothetical protein
MELPRKAMTAAAFEALPSSASLVPIFGDHVKMWKVQIIRNTRAPRWALMPYWIICEENVAEDHVDTNYYRAVIRVKAGRFEWQTNTSTP